MTLSSFFESVLQFVQIAFEIEKILSSNGCRITSKTERLNSDSSSMRNNLPHCNSLIVSHKVTIKDQNMYHKAIHNHKDSASRKQFQINLCIVEMQPILVKPKIHNKNVLLGP